VLLADVGARTQLMRLDVSHALEAGATLGGADGDAPAAAAGGRGGAAPQPVIADMPVASRFDLAADGETVALVASTSQHPAEVYVGSLRERTTRRLSEHSAEALTGVRLGRQEVIEWLGAESLPIQGVLTYPVDFEEAARYPLVIHPHGGPEGVSQDGWNTFAQLLAGRGYLVLQPNYRGSGGRGVAFSKGDHDDLGGREFEDILAGLRMLVERGLADEQRVAMAGWSYGGYLSAMAATHHSETFDAAVMGAGISNWVSFAGTTDIPHEMSLVHWNRYAYDNFAL